MKPLPGRYEQKRDQEGRRPVPASRSAGRPPTASASAALIVLASLALLLPDLAAATPTVRFKAKAVSIPGFRHTGNIRGAGAAFAAEYSITGTEYGGFPPPLIGVTVYLPAGVVLHPKGFRSCPLSTLEPSGLGPRHCPKRSIAGPRGTVEGFVAFGSKVVPETATVEPFFASGGGLTFFTYGHNPTILEVISEGRLVRTHGTYSHKLVSSIPLVETVPGAQDASVKSIRLTVGAAFRAHGKTVFYGRMPKRCPKRYLPVKTTLTFAGLGGLEQTTVTKSYRAPCPRRR